MAQASVKYGKLVLSANDASTEAKLGQVVDDVLGLLDAPERGAQRENEVAAYGVFGLLGPSSRTAHMRTRKLVRDGVPRDVLRAANQASEGRLDPWLAPHLARVRFSQGDGPDDVPDLLALTAWTLLQAATTGRFRVTRCEWCGLQWFTAGQGRYCDRLAPGASPESTQTCRRVASLHNFRDRDRQRKGTA